jgi:hypothetical protein
MKIYFLWLGVFYDNAIKLKIPSFQGKKIPRHIWSGRKRWIEFLIAITIQSRRK